MEETTKTAELESRIIELEKKKLRLEIKLETLMDLYEELVRLLVQR